MSLGAAAALCARRAVCLRNPLLEGLSVAHSKPTLTVVREAHSAPNSLKQLTAADSSQLSDCLLACLLTYLLIAAHPLLLLGVFTPYFLIQYHSKEADSIA